jgi:hypothetical protein
MATESTEEQGKNKSYNCIGCGVWGVGCGEWGVQVIRSLALTGIRNIVMYLLVQGNTVYKELK